MTNNQDVFIFLAFDGQGHVPVCILNNQFHFDVLFHFALGNRTPLTDKELEGYAMQNPAKLTKHKVCLFAISNKIRDYWCTLDDFAEINNAIVGDQGRMRVQPADEWEEFRGIARGFYSKHQSVKLRDLAETICKDSITRKLVEFELPCAKPLFEYCDKRRAIIQGVGTAVAAGADAAATTTEADRANHRPSKRSYVEPREAVDDFNADED